VHGTVWDPLGWECSKWARTDVHGTVWDRTNGPGLTCMAQCGTGLMGQD
jgi:hypothetical protein